MSTQHDPNATQAYQASSVPTTGFQAAPPAAEPQWYQQPSPAAPPAGDRQPDGTPRYTSNSGHGPVGNWLRTGDSKLNVDSEQGRALKPAIADGWSVAGLICAFFVPIAGVILSLVAFADAKKNQRRVHGTAVGGFFVGSLLSIVWTLYWVVVIFAMVSLSNAVGQYPAG